MKFLRQLFNIRESESLDIFSCGNEKYSLALQDTAFVCFGIMVIAHIIMLFTFSGQQITDASSYYFLAKNAVKAGTWYPSVANLHDAYFFGNGVVNLIALSLRLTGGITCLFVLNALFIYTTLFSCVYIIKKIFASSQVHWWFMIIFCLFGTFWGEIVSLRTEIPFTALLFLSLALLHSKKPWLMIVSGIILGLANWTRPLGTFCLFGGIWILINNREKWWKYAMYIGGYAVMLLAIGLFSYSQCGHFIYQSTTSGYNLIMGANDDADGSTNFNVFFDENAIGYISDSDKADMIYSDYDKFYKEKGIEWIKQNPVKYLSLMPKKLFYTLATETYGGSSFYNNELDTSGMDYIKLVASKLMFKSETPLTIGDIIVIWTQLLYMLCCVLYAIGTVYLLVKRRIAAFMPYYFISFMGLIATVILVGGARYHFPFLPIFFIIAAAMIQRFCVCRQKMQK